MILVEWKHLTSLVNGGEEGTDFNHASPIRYQSDPPLVSYLDFRASVVPILL